MVNAMAKSNINDLAQENRKLIGEILQVTSSVRTFIKGYGPPTERGEIREAPTYLLEDLVWQRDHLMEIIVALRDIKDVLGD